MPELDPIKNMISATDPLRNDPSAPDSEAALRRMLSEPAAFSDRLPAGATSLAERRLRRARVAGAITLATAAVTAGVLAAINLAPVTPAPGPAITVTGSESPTPTSPGTASLTAPGTAPTAQTFVFPDGHLSFSYPEGWSVRTEPGPFPVAEAKAGSVVAVVTDGSGSEMARVYSGMYGDGGAGRVKRTVLDRAPVPGITDVSGNQAEFGFASDQILPDPYLGTPGPAEPSDGSAPYYFMDVRLAPEFQPTQESSGTNQILLPNGLMAAYAVLDAERQSVLATPDAAKAWMASERYAQLKALLLSLNYS